VSTDDEESDVSESRTETAAAFYLFTRPNVTLAPRTCYMPHGAALRVVSYSYTLKQ